MRSRDEAKLNMYRTVQNICDDNIALITTIPAFLLIYNTFKALIVTIISIASAESLELSGITIDKSVAKKNFCQAATDMAALIFAFASSTGDNTLKQQVNFSFTDLGRLKDELLTPTIQNILNAATTNAAALLSFGVTPESIAALQASMDVYSTAVPKPRSAKVLKETTSRDLKLKIKDADEMLKSQMDKFAGNFKTTNLNFATAYKLARVIIDPTTSTTQIKGSITNEAGEAAIANATVQIVGLTAAVVTTNAAGDYIQKPVIPGIYQVTVKAPGFADKTITGVEVQLGKTTTLNIQLTPLV